jgi:hypothetical protein
MDAASGDHQPADNVLGTFNPLFPNGYYFTLAGFTGYVNLFHVKPSLTVKPATNLSVMGAGARTTADAIYVQPNIPVAERPRQGLVGRLRAIARELSLQPDRRTGSRALQDRDTIRQAGSHDATCRCRNEVCAVAAVPREALIARQLEAPLTATEP